MFRLAVGVNVVAEREKQLDLPLLIFFFSKCQVPLARQGSIEAASKWLQS